MPPTRELAPAKVNLTLEVAGCRADGFHVLESLVVFASVGDVVTLDPDGPAGVTVGGPQAGGLVGPNVLDQAVALLRARAPQLAIGAIHLDKQLPVAAGVGGGSADAAALLRAVRRANGSKARGVDWGALARELGSDVTVCLDSRTRWATGVGHDVAEVPDGVPALSAVLLNPMAAVPSDKTAQVYRALDAKPLPDGYVPPSPPRFADREALLAFMRARGNHLSPAAEAVVAETGAVLRALRDVPGVEHVAVSGGGPTCFGVFGDAAGAEAARACLAAAHPGWWVAAITLCHSNSDTVV